MIQYTLCPKRGFAPGISDDKYSRFKGPDTRILDSVAADDEDDDGR